uniref:Uncharacterized protein n=1 Tax=Salix viminalis TaxID=40686 RepID=A0A6N2N4T3_SALVM
MGFSQPVGENYANPKTRLFHVDFKESLARMNKKNPWLFGGHYTLMVLYPYSDAKKQIRGFASQAIASHFTSTIGSAISAV